MTPAFATPAAQPAHRMGAFEPSVLRSNRLFESRDLDEARERISRVMQPHEVWRVGGCADGGAGSHMDFVRVGGIGLGTIDFGEAVQLEVDAIDDYHLLMFCLRGRAETRVDGRPIAASTHEGIVCAPGRDFSAALSPDCEQFVVRLDRAMVQGHAGAEVHFNESLDLRRPELQPWLEQVRAMATSPFLLASAQRNPLIAVELERLLVLLLLEGQGRHVAPEPRASRGAGPGIAPACVHRAEAYMQAHVDEPLCLADIAQAAQVPVRTLLDAFKRFRDHAPMQYLKELRLELARRRLQRPDAATRVSSVALDCGFLHLGRFSQAYSRRFGESPSVTLQANL
ncbi:anthranilate 1,2-dioxygenase regulatory protein AndR [Variovorax sp. J22P168]|uniref:anthranilate 1,2-dioxygenase regulatory protein AndR n=1 Tax=Variovorax jilinensis TaxID=3053513 RepID=UPI002577A4AA|nr:anthranilate 1,2-dioxygenase regulatory protein AndR [Variovorax sp. J22P168]MDM0012970.1 anthranilate 1,2-dioxygenase regulatory protein AndR [Variovorax sp. J22P168]